MDVENDEQAEQSRNKESDVEEHDRIGHDTTLLNPNSGLCRDRPTWNPR